MSKQPSQELKDKVINRLNEEFSFNLDLSKVDIITYSGSVGEGAYKWFTLGISPQINSHITLTATLKAENISYFYKEIDKEEGVEIEEGVHKTGHSYVGSVCKPLFLYENSK